MFFVIEKVYYETVEKNVTQGSCLMSL